MQLVRSPFPTRDSSVSLRLVVVNDPFSNASTTDDEYDPPRRTTTRTIPVHPP